MSQADDHVNFPLANAYYAVVGYPGQTSCFKIRMPGGAHPVYSSTSLKSCTKVNLMMIHRDIMSWPTSCFREIEGETRNPGDDGEGKEELIKPNQVFNLLPERQ